MSCLYVQVGQAGNQIGQAFWGLAEEEFLVQGGTSAGVGRVTATSRRESLLRLRPGGLGMFHEDGSARCLAIDSEPKVVESFRSQVRSLRPESALYTHSGLANNWAMGFECCRQVREGGADAEAGLFERSMEGVRREAERCSWLNSVVMLHSLAGGTGSGFGSGLLQALRDEYPSLYLISICVGAFGSGETPLQHYNSTLALQHLHAFADAIVFRGNEDLLVGTRSASASRVRAEQRPEPSRAGNVGGSRHGARSHPLAGSDGRAGSVAGAEGRVSIADMNASFSLDLASYFFPRSLSLLSAAADPFASRCALRPSLRSTCGRRSSEGGARVAAPRNFDGGSLVASACPIASAKFVDLRSTLPLVGAPITSTSAPGWAELAGALARAAPLRPRMGGGQTRDACVAAHHVLRGLDWSTGAGTVTRRGASREHREKGGGRKPESKTKNGWVDATVASASAEAGDVIRKHTGCPEWRTATDVSFSAALRRAGVPRSVTSACNQTRIRFVLRDVLSRAELKFGAKAYLHWYYRHGLEEEDFLAAFESLRGVARGYDGLAKALGTG